MIRPQDYAESLILQSNEIDKHKLDELEWPYSTFLFNVQDDGLPHNSFCDKKILLGEMNAKTKRICIRQC